MGKIKSMKESSQMIVEPSKENTSHGAKHSKAQEPFANLQVFPERSIFANQLT